MELIDKFNKRKEFLNKKSERSKKIPGEYGQSVHIWIMNTDNKFLIQKRANSRKIFPNKWSITAGAVDNGETSLEGALREAKEELGLDLNKENIEFMLSIKRTNSFLDVWLAREDINIEDIIMQEEEVSDVKWVEKEEFEKMIEKEEVAGTVKIYYEMFIYLLENFS